MRSKPAPLFAVAILAFAYLSLIFLVTPHSFLENILFFAVVQVEVVMIAAGWWYCFQNRKANDIAIWRKRIAWVAVIANTSALGIPIVSLM